MSERNSVNFKRNKSERQDSFLFQVMPSLPSSQHVLSCVNPECVMKMNSMAKTVNEIRLTSPKTHAIWSDDRWTLAQDSNRQDYSSYMVSFVISWIWNTILLSLLTSLLSVWLFPFPLTLTRACKNANKVKFKHTPEHQLWLERFKINNSKQNPDLKQPLAKGQTSC